jgi:hypothetical protein
VEPRAPTADPAGHGGMIVMVRPDPAESARALALDLHAELVLGRPATLDLLRRLDDQVPHPGQVDTADEPRSLDATLDDLTVAMRRAEAVRDATRSQTADRLAATLNTRLAIHPDTIRRAALEVLAVRHDLADATTASVRRSGHRRQALVAAIATVVLLAGAGLAASRGWSAGTIATGSAAAVTVVVAILALIASRSARSSVDLAELHTAHHLAERRWSRVSPPQTPPEDVELVIHRYEPQHRTVASLVGEHPAVRAAERAAVARRMAWVSAWRETLGDDAPLAIGPAAHRLEADALRHAEAEVVLPDPPVTGAVLVVASPYDDLSEAEALRLHRHLIDPPGGRRVIVVLPPDPETGSGARLPGSGWISSDPGDAF